jgi:IS5 family transposase
MVHISFADFSSRKPGKIFRKNSDSLQLIDWSRIESLLTGLHSSPRGEKAWPPLMMFKALLLQSWYALSDPALEKQLARDLLFRRFIGLSISESVPDHSTLWRFRQLLEKQNLMTTLPSRVYTLKRAKSVSLMSV